MVSFDMTKSQKLLSSIPKIDKLIESPHIANLFAEFPRELILNIIREELEDIRHDLVSLHDEDINDVVEEMEQFDYSTYLYAKLEARLKPNIRRCINAAGIILHTGLGRAPLSKSARDALDDVSSGYANVELVLETGKRGNRHDIVQELLVQLTGAEAGAVVNNNAAATLLVLNSLSNAKECIISRGELVTIGGSFRIPDIMEKSGAVMKEVGTTNHTWEKDYEDAISEETGILMKIHRSNFKIKGFTSEVCIKDLVTLGRKYAIPVVHDLGSGSLLDLSRYGLPKEPVVGESIAAGADVIMFSGDKLLGGPQAGIVIGKSEYIDVIKKNQLARALRCDKLTLAALEATLRLFFDESSLKNEHPVLRMLTEDKNVVRNRALKLLRRLKNNLKDVIHMDVEAGVTEIGGGSLATETIETYMVTLSSDKYSSEVLSSMLRKAQPPVVSRISDDQVLLDMRTVHDEEIKMIALSMIKIADQLKAMN